VAAAYFKNASSHLILNTLCYNPLRLLLGLGAAYLPINLLDSQNYT